MKNSIWSEKNLVAGLFIAVIIIFSFAQADSSKVESTFLDGKPTSTSSNEQPKAQVEKPAVRVPVPALR